MRLNRNLFVRRPFDQTSSRFLFGSVYSPILSSSIPCVVYGLELKKKYFVCLNVECELEVLLRAQKVVLCWFWNLLEIEIHVERSRITQTKKQI